jgi:N-acetylmuramoyl-L-alanine amidase
MVADLEVLFAGRTGCKVYLRNSGKFSLADDYAVSHGCDLFWENHLNSGGGTGTEVLYDATKCQHMAEYTSQNIATALHVRDRGDKRRTDLAVLEPHAGMWSLIVEWWFADNKDDLAKWGKYRYQAELAAINSILSHYGWKHVKSLPRKWTRLQRRLYKPF